MKLAPAQLVQHLAKNLLPIYVVAGDEPLLVDESLDALRAKCRALGYTEREVLDVERGFDWSRLMGACQAMSLFASRRLVELRMPGGAPGKDGGELLQEVAVRPPADTVLLVICGALDWKQQQSNWYGALENAGASVYARAIAAADWPHWIEQRLRDAGLVPDEEAVRLLAERTEGNGIAAAQDVAKLKLLYPDSRIGVEEVREAVADSARFDAFDLADRMLGGDAPGALRSLARLREEGLEPVEILGALTWTLRLWAQAQTEYARNPDAQRACSAARVPRPRMAAFEKALPRTRLTQIYGWLRACAQIDSLAKSTGGKEQAWEELLTLAAAAAGRRIMRSPAA